MGRTLCFTGLNAKELYGYSDIESYKRLLKKIYDIIKEYPTIGYDTFISTGAQGSEQIFFKAVEHLKKQYPDRGIKNIIYAPCHNQDNLWADRGLFGQPDYASIIEKADMVVYTSDFYSPKCLIENRENMLRDADALLAMYKDNSWQYTFDNFTAKAMQFARKNDIPIQQFYLGKYNPARKEQKEVKANPKIDYINTVKDFINLSKGKEFFIVDTETTGTDAKRHEILEISALKVDGDTLKILDSFDTTVNIGKDLPPDIEIFNNKNKTGINNEVISKSPVPEEVAVNFKAFVGENPIIMGHNIPFDIRFIEKFYRKNLKTKFTPMFVLDTLQMAKEKLDGSHKLSDIYEQIPNTTNDHGFHNSLADIQANLTVYKFLLSKYDIKDQIKDNEKNNEEIEL